MARHVLKAMAVTVVILGAAACSSENNHDMPNTELAPHLCDTTLSTTPIKKLFPGPYDDAFQSFSGNDSLSSLKRGNKRGTCIIGLDYDQNNGVHKTVDVNIEAEVASETTKEYVGGWEKLSLSADATVKSGDLQGVAGWKGAVVAFPCKERPGRVRSIGVTVDFTPDDPGITEKRKKLISRTSTQYAVQVARYLKGHYLKCVDSPDMSGSITMRPS